MKYWYLKASTGYLRSTETARRLTRDHCTRLEQNENRLYIVYSRILHFSLFSIMRLPWCSKVWIVYPPGEGEYPHVPGEVSCPWYDGISEPVKMGKGGVLPREVYARDLSTPAGQRYAGPVGIIIQIISKRPSLKNFHHFMRYCMGCPLLREATCPGKAGVSG